MATITSAAVEVGQGFVTLAQQIARDVLESSTWSWCLRARRTSARQGRLRPAARPGCPAELFNRPALRCASGCSTSVASRHGVARETLEILDERVVSLDREINLPVSDATPGQVLEETVEFHHAPTVELDANGQGDAFVSFAFAAHRVVVDVDLDLGLVRVVEIATSQDVGRVLNPVQLVGQLEGGIAQGVGLAVMEEIVLDHGRVRNPSFTDYVIPTALDMPPVHIAALIEEGEPGSPMGAKGAGEPPMISSVAAVVAVIRDATGLELPRAPVRPQDIALVGSGPGPTWGSGSINVEVSP